MPKTYNVLAALEQPAAEPGAEVDVLRPGDSVSYSKLTKEWKQSDKQIKALIDSGAIEEA